MIRRWGNTDKLILNEAIISVEDEITNMNTLIEKLFFIAKENELKINYSEVELSDLIMECITGLKIQYPNLRIHFNPEYIIINTDRELLKILIKNILDNSIKYGNNKPVIVSLEELKNKKYILSIKDSGIGMTKENISRICDRFYRADKSRNGKIYGHGLGMYIVKKIATLLDINLEIESEIEKGSEFKLYFKTDKYY